MNKWFEILFGLILLNVSVYLAVSSSGWGAFWDFGNAAWIFLKGGFLWGLFFVGILFIILGISDLKE